MNIKNPISEPLASLKPPSPLFIDVNHFSGIYLNNIVPELVFIVKSGITTKYGI